MSTGFEQQDKEIDGVVYRVTPLGMNDAQKILLRIGKLVGPAAMGSVTNANDLARAIAAAIDETVIIGILDALRDKTNVRYSDGRELPLRNEYNAHFAGAGMVRWLPWLAWALEVNFGPFFASLPDLLGLLGVTMTKPSLSPTAPTGGSGA